MKNDKLIDAIGLIQDDYVKEAHEKKPKKFTIPWPLIGKIAGAACALILIINILPLGRKSASSAGGNYYSEMKDEGTSYYGYDAGASESYYMAEDAVEYESTAPSNNSSPTLGQNQNLTQNKKMILTAHMNLDT